MKRGEEGMVTAFVVIMVVALLLVAGLVVDGGSMLAAKRQAINEAEAAARAGAQALDESAYRNSAVVKIDPELARQAAQRYIAATGDTGTVEVQDDTVTVKMRRTQSNSILGLIGMQKVELTGTGSARGVRGLEGEE